MKEIIPFSELQVASIGREFEGYRFNNTSITFIVVEAPTGIGPEIAYPSL